MRQTRPLSFPTSLPQIYSLTHIFSPICSPSVFCCKYKTHIVQFATNADICMHLLAENCPGKMFYFERWCIFWFVLHDTALALRFLAQKWHSCYGTQCAVANSRETRLTNVVLRGHVYILGCWISHTEKDTCPSQNTVCSYSPCVLGNL